MKKFFCILAFTLSTCLCVTLSAQVFADYVQRPWFLNQDASAFRKWVDERVVFDPEAKAEGLGGRVLVKFTVEADGSVDKVKVLRGLDRRLDEEAVRVVSSSPKWAWSTDAEPKPVSFTISVIFDNDTPCPYPYDEFEYAGKSKVEKFRIYSVTHGSIVIDAPFHSIIIDPVMEMGGRKFAYGWFKPGSKTILLTHEHGDHLDKKAVDYLTDAFGTKYNIYGNAKSIDILGRGDVLHNGDTLSVKGRGIHIKAVPAYNTTRDRLKFHPKGNGNGYLIEIGDVVIYVAGDTEVIPEMRKLGKVDIAVLPVNQPYTMTPEQCIRAAKIIRPKVLIPYHMGGTDMSAVMKAFEGSGIQVIFHEEL